MIDLNAKLHIEKLGARGEGVARDKSGLLFVPFALAGEDVLAEVDDDRTKLIEVLNPSPDRIEALCPYFTLCGGCAVQNLAPAAYVEWKRSLVVDALRNAGIEAPVGPLVEAWGSGRRRASFHSRCDQRGQPHVGFMQARAHQIVEIAACPILTPELAEALPVARAIALALAPLNKPLDIIVTATAGGLDVDLRGCGKLEFEMEQALVEAAKALDLARIANHGAVVVERRPPALAMGLASVIPPPGGFLQATQAGEEALAQLVLAAAGESRRIADLFCGVGTFALRLAAKAEVWCVENDLDSLAAGLRASRGVPGLHALKGEARDLFTRPLLAGELKFDCVVFDPPRAGAERQAKELAQSAVPLVIGVSCNVQSFARDAKALLEGGYVLETVTPVDQFLYAPHVELVGVFKKTSAKPGKKRRLLG